MARVKQNSKANYARKVKQVPCEKTGSGGWTRTSDQAVTCGAVFHAISSSQCFPDTTMIALPGPFGNSLERSVLFGCGA